MEITICSFGEAPSFLLQVYRGRDHVSVREECVRNIVRTVSKYLLNQVSFIRTMALLQYFLNEIDLWYIFIYSHRVLSSWSTTNKIFGFGSECLKLRT